MVRESELSFKVVLLFAVRVGRGRQVPLPPWSHLRTACPHQAGRSSHPSNPCERTSSQRTSLRPSSSRTSTISLRSSTTSSSFSPLLPQQVPSCVRARAWREEPCGSCRRSQGWSPDARPSPLPPRRQVSPARPWHLGGRSHWHCSLPISSVQQLRDSVLLSRSSLRQLHRTLWIWGIVQRQLLLRKARVLQEATQHQRLQLR